MEGVDKVKLLIVDDSLFAQQFVKKIVLNNLSGIQILLASSGQQAFEIYKDEHPDCIITDLLMPEMRGDELIGLIREIDQTVKIIVHSADIQKAVKDEMLNYNVLGFINKPMNAEKSQLLIQLLEEGSDAQLISK